LCETAIVYVCPIEKIAVENRSHNLKLRYDSIQSFLVTILNTADLASVTAKQRQCCPAEALFPKRGPVKTPVLITINN